MGRLILILTIMLSGYTYANSEVSLLISRREAKNARLRMILEETREIRYNTFVFDLDDTGKEIIGALADAAQRGVKVKLILDDLPPGLAKNPHILQALSDMGVEIRIFNPITKRPLDINLRNHIKSLISSNEMIIGGRNTQNPYYKEFIDIEAKVKGRETLGAKEHFDTVFNSREVIPPKGSKSAIEIAQAKTKIQEWMKKAKELTYRPRQFLKAPEQVDELAYYADPPNIKDKRVKGIDKEIIKMLDRSEKSLEILNPYVLISPEEKAALKRASDRGVKIRIITNASTVTDSSLAAMAWDIKKFELLDMGIEVFESKEYYVHGKTIIRDNVELFVGSFNLDMRSQYLNLENGIFFKSKKLAHKLSAHKRRLLKMSMEEVKRKVQQQKGLVQKGVHCVRDGIRNLIIELAYPHL